MKEDIRLLYIDLFCGAGGTSTGVENAAIDGCKIAKVIACVNHDRNAIASHKANHPDAVHYTEDIRTLDLGPVERHVSRMRNAYPDALVVLWASLECTNFSRAKGGMSRDADSRTLAEHLFRYVEALRPDIIQIENVDEFQTWGPLVEKRGQDGTVVMTRKSSGKGRNRHSWTEPAMLPDPDHKGEYYRRWVANMCAYGYHFDWRLLNSADYGAYTSRKRFFGMFARPGIPIVFPRPTHCKNAGSLFSDGLKPWKAVREVLDLDDVGESIFDRRRPLVEATLRRIYAGLEKFIAGGRDNYNVRLNGLKTAFLSKAYSGDPSGKQVGIDAPCGTITTSDHHQFITAYYRDLPSFSARKSVPDVFIDNQYGSGKASSADVPCGTITNVPKQSPVYIRRTPILMPTHFSNLPQSLDSPARTVTADRHWSYLVNPQFSSRGCSIADPAPTVIARQDKLPLQLASVRTGGRPLPSFVIDTAEGLTYVFDDADSETMKKIKWFMLAYGIVDISMRMLRISELKQIQGFPKDYILVGTQEEQKKYLGNAVVTVMSKVWCETMVKDYGMLHRAAV